MEKLNKKPVEALKKQIAEVEKKIKTLIKEDNSLKHLFEIVTSVDGVGEVVFCEMVIATNEFKLFSDRRPVVLESLLAIQGWLLLSIHRVPVSGEALG